MPSQTLNLSASISGHVWLYQGKRQETWCAKWRDTRGQHEKRLGRNWIRKGPPPQGYLRKRDAEALLEEILVEARRGQLRQQDAGVTFRDVAEDWYAKGPMKRDWSASTRVDYRSVLDAHLLPAFGSRRIETITAAQFEQWRDGLANDGNRTRKTVNKIATQAHAIFEHAVDHFEVPTKWPPRSSAYANRRAPDASSSSPHRKSHSSPPQQREALIVTRVAQPSAIASESCAPKPTSRMQRSS
jgi:hypothetical protein